MNILTAPFHTLFSLKFYREVARSPLHKGFLYLFYLTCIMTLIVVFLFTTRVMPEMDNFVDWVKADMPDLVWTPDGLTMNRQSPYTMVHVEYGPLIMFDMSIENLTAETMPDVPVIVTSTKIFVRQGVNEIRMYDVTVPREEQPPNIEPVAITPETVQEFYGSIKPWSVFLAVVFFLPFFYVWKLLSALVYSLLGLLINTGRNPKLSYGAIYNLMLFVLTPTIFIQAMQMLFPPLGIIPFGFLGALLVTGIYVFLAVKKTEERTEPAV